MRDKDIAEKALENMNDVFADIVNALIFDGEPIVKVTELEQTLPRETYKENGTYHEQERDVVKAWKNGTIRIAMLALENQSAVDYDMPLRVISYDGASYGKQVGSRSQKERYPVITLVLYFGEKPWSGPKSLKERLTIPAGAEQYVNDYKLHIIEMSRLSREKIEKFQSDFRIIAEYFWHEAMGEDYYGDDRVLEHPQEVANLLLALTEDPRFDIDVEKQKARRSQEMMRSKMLDRAEERGEKRGLELGEKRGLELGEKRGLEIGQKRGLELGERLGEQRGLSSSAAMVRLYMEGNDISKVAEVIGKDEKVVREFLTEAGMLPK